MPRKVVPLVTGEIYHVYNRGVDKRNIFENKGDYLRFYASLKHFNCEFPVGSLRDVPKNGDAPKPLVSIIAYAMLPNHFHLLIKQVADNGLSEFMKRVLGGYTTHFNENNNRSGSLFQGSYKRIHVVSDDYYKYLFSYINENHIVHGLTSNPQIFSTSSLHYQKILQSKLICDNYENNYNVAESQILAKDIYSRRLELKSILHEE